MKTDKFTGVMSGHSCKKMLYIMGIDWGWIYQRPQIIEQYLEQHYNVTVVFPRSITQCFKKTRQKLPAAYQILWTLPWQEKNQLIGWVSKLINRRLLRQMTDYDIIWIGYPLYYRYIPETYNGRIIYDCMDNHEALYPYQKGVSAMIAQETALAVKCDLLLVSSNNLYNKIAALPGVDQEKMHLIRNGVSIRQIWEVRPAEVKKRYKIGYFGTIAEWFDYDVLLESLERFDQIEYHLIGPIVKKCEKEHPGIIYEGVVDHDKLAEFTKQYDCLIMPFVVNDVVEGVDPVKLYEYIALGKCIISVDYPEIARFGEFAYLYAGTERYLQVLENLISRGFPAKYQRKQQVEFLEDNSWEKRFEQINEVI